MRLPNVGDIFAGRFRIEQELGRGGFATVYGALDATTMGSVALKILHAEGGAYDSAARARFRREVDVVAQLRDPHTVRLLAHGEDQGLLWAAFEQVPGRDLAALLESVGRLDAPRVRHILHQVLLSLREAHSRGLVHRDLKPENVRVFDGPEGPLTVKVLDFGIARSTDTGAPSLTATGELVGTPRYMSPEQLRGQPLTPASDIYTAGLLAYELLAGRDALGGNTIGHQLDRISGAHRFEILGADPQTQALLGVVRRMLDPEPQTRLRSCDAVLAALQGPAPAPPMAGPLDPPASHVPRARAGGSGGVIAIVGLVLVMLVAVIVVLVRRADDQPVLRTNPPVPGALLRGNSAPAPPQDIRPAAESDAGPALRGLPVPFEGMLRFPGAQDKGVFVFVPASFAAEKPAAIVILFPDSIEGITGPQFLDYFGFREVAERENLVVVVPPDRLWPKLGGVLHVSGWHFPAVEAAAAAVAGLRERRGLVDAPVFALGEARGGTAIDRYIARGLSPEFTAVATSAVRYRSGNPAVSEPDEFAEQRGSEIEERPLYPGRVPRLDLSPRDDRFRPYDGGMTRAQKPDGPFLSVKHRRAQLAEAHGCAERPRRKLPGGTAGTCWWYDCTTRLEVCEVAGSRYWTADLPWHPAEAGKYGGFDFTGAVWEFFRSVRDDLAQERREAPGGNPGPDGKD